MDAIIYLVGLNVTVMAILPVASADFTSERFSIAQSLVAPCHVQSIARR
jgi:hypothetical protein